MERLYQLNRGVAISLNQTVDHLPILVDGPPEIMALALDVREHFLGFELCEKLCQLRKVTFALSQNPSDEVHS